MIYGTLNNTIYKQSKYTYLINGFAQKLILFDNTDLIYMLGLLYRSGWILHCHACHAVVCINEKNKSTERYQTEMGHKLY